MILGTIAREVAARMKARGIAVTVVYGHDTPKPVSTAPYIVVSHDEGASETFEAPTGSRGAFQASHFTRWTSAMAEIQSQSTQTGAGEEANKIACEALTDAFLIDLHVVCTTRRNPLRNVQGFFVPSEDPNAKRQVGARYELSFQVGRSILETVGIPAADPLIATPTVIGVQGDATEVACPTDSD